VSHVTVIVLLCHCQVLDLLNKYKSSFLFLRYFALLSRKSRYTRTLHKYKQKQRFFTFMYDLYRKVYLPKSVKLLELSERIHQKLLMKRYFKRFWRFVFHSSECIINLNIKCSFVENYTINRLLQDVWAKWWVAFVSMKEDKSLRLKYLELVRTISHRDFVKDRKCVQNAWNMWVCHYRQKERINQFMHESYCTRMRDVIRIWKTQVVTVCQYIALLYMDH